MFFSVRGFILLNIFKFEWSTTIFFPEKMLKFFETLVHKRQQCCQTALKIYYLVTNFLKIEIWEPKVCNGMYRKSSSYRSTKYCKHLLF